MTWVDDWASRGACKTSDPDTLFVQGAAQNRAKAVCMGCPVRTECLSDALDNRVEFGVWGGMTERERRALLRRRPNVTSWRQLLETARSEFERGACAPTSSRWLCSGERRADLPQAVQVVHVPRLSRYVDHRHPRVRSSEPAAQSLLPRHQPHPVGVQAAAARPRAGALPRSSRVSAPAMARSADSVVAARCTRLSTSPASGISSSPSRSTK